MMELTEGRVGRRASCLNRDKMLKAMMDGLIIAARPVYMKHTPGSGGVDLNLSPSRASKLVPALD